MSWIPWQSVQRATTAPFTGVPWLLRSDAVLPPGAGLRDRDARRRGFLHVVGAVAIHAERRRAIAARDGLLVHAVEGLRVVVEVALAALLVERHGYGAAAGEGAWRMRYL